MKTAHLVPALLATLAVLALLVGCGSSTSAVFGQNSRAEVKAVSPNIGDMHLIVSPRMGAANASGTCSDTAEAFGCTRLLSIDTITLTFTTDEEASTQPYYVYLTNTATVVRTATVQVRMDGDLKVDQAFDVPAGATVRVARIYRNSANSP